MAIAHGTLNLNVGGFLFPDDDGGDGGDGDDGGGRARFASSYSRQASCLFLRVGGTGGRHRCWLSRCSDRGDTPGHCVTWLQQRGPFPEERQVPLFPGPLESWLSGERVRGAPTRSNYAQLRAVAAIEMTKAAHVPPWTRSRGNPVRLVCGAAFSRLRACAPTRGTPPMRRAAVYFVPLSLPSSLLSIHAPPTLPAELDFLVSFS